MSLDDEQRIQINNSLLKSTLEGVAFNMAESGLAYREVPVGAVADILKPLQLARGMNPTGWKQLAEELQFPFMTSSRGNEYFGMLVPGKKPKLAFERNDADWNLVDQTNIPTVKKAVFALEKFNTLPFYQTSREVKLAIDGALKEDGVVEFMQFTCPPINGRLLSPSGSEEYILTDPTGSNLEADGKGTRLSKVVDAVQQTGLSTRLRLIVGDNDEPDYMFPVLGAPMNYDSERAEERKDAYAKNLAERVSNQYPQWNATVERMSAIEKETDTPETPTVLDEQTQQDMNVEFEQMKTVFLAGGYYDGLKRPSDEELKQIVELKFRTYRRQGIALARKYPNAVLFQNEFPVDLRTRMLDAGLVQLGKSRLAVLNPYGR